MRSSILEADAAQKKLKDHNVSSKQNLGLGLRLRMEPQQYADLISVYSPPK